MQCFEEVYKKTSPFGLVSWLDFKIRGCFEPVILDSIWIHDLNLSDFSDSLLLVSP